MITLPIWLLIMIGLIGLPVLVGIIAFMVLCIKSIIIMFRVIIEESVE